MSTVIVSGRVDENIKKIADRYIKKQGLTTAEVISNVWRQIADTGEIPMAQNRETSEARMRIKFNDLRERTPKATPLSLMSDADLKEVLSNRE